MRRSPEMTFRFFLVVAVLATVPVVLAPSSSTDTPYLSALSDLGAAPAFAAKPCDNKTCMRNAQGKALCQANPNTNCIRRPSGVLCGGTAC